MQLQSVWSHIEAINQPSISLVVVMGESRGSYGYVTLTADRKSESVLVASGHHFRHFMSLLSFVYYIIAPTSVP